jgi:protein-disulfide isomerase
MMKAIAPTLTIPVSDRDHMRGPATAALTLVEYGDYECPHCRAAHPIVKHLLQRLGDDLRFVYRNFPLTEIHPHAATAAVLAEAAGRQQKFWDMHDALFERQQLVIAGTFGSLVEALGLDEAQVASDIADASLQARVQEDFMSGVRSGVNGTPTFFVNNVRFDGSWDTELEPYLQALLKEV